MRNQKVAPPQKVKKMKQGMSYTGKEKTIILNVFKYFRKERPDLCITEVVRRTSQATGCSEKSIFNFRKEEVRPEGFKEPSKTKIRKNININSRFNKYDKNIRVQIRNVLYELKTSNGFPSLNAVLKSINTNHDLPNFSLMTLRRLLFDMGFYYEKKGNKSVLLEKNAENIDPKITDTKESVSTKQDVKGLEETKKNKKIPNTEYEFPQQIIPHPSVNFDREQNTIIPKPFGSSYQEQNSKENQDRTANIPGGIPFSNPYKPMAIFSHRIAPPYGIHPPVSSTGGSFYSDLHMTHENQHLYHHGIYASHHPNMI